MRKQSLRIKRFGRLFRPLAERKSRGSLLKMNYMKSWYEQSSYQVRTAKCGSLLKMVYMKS